MAPTPQQEATLVALEKGVDGVPDARPLNVEAKDLRALTTLIRAQQTDITTLTTQHEKVLTALSEAREEIAKLRSQPDA